ncbi:MAG: hypothetical protein LUE99_19060 [Bacteroides sp.]|nr:hypothetical protein [Bacteroides sp.]
MRKELLWNRFQLRMPDWHYLTLFSRLFKLLGYLDDSRQFKDEDSKVRAIFVLEYLVYGEQREYPEAELYLNKLLVGKTDNKPLPRSCPLTEEEMKTTDELLSSIKVIWDKMKNTSETAIRYSFVQREGLVTDDDGRGMKKWNIKVSERAYDVLLDTLPWSFKLIRYPWMDYMIETYWRN